MLVSIVFDRVIESETTRLGSKRLGQLSAMFGLTGSRHAKDILCQEGVDPILTSDRRFLPEITKEKYAEVGQRVFDSSLSLTYLAWPSTASGQSANNMATAMKLSKIYEEVLDIVVPVDDIITQLMKMRKSGL